MKISIDVKTKGRIKKFFWIGFNVINLLVLLFGAIHTFRFFSNQSQFDGIAALVLLVAYQIGSNKEKAFRS